MWSQDCVVLDSMIVLNLLPETGLSLDSCEYGILPKIYPRFKPFTGKHQQIQTQAHHPGFNQGRGGCSAFWSCRDAKLEGWSSWDSWLDDLKL